MPQAFVVLNDGETYTNIEGCSIVVIADDMVEQLDEHGDIRNVPVLLEIPLTVCTQSKDNYLGHHNEEVGC